MTGAIEHRFGDYGGQFVPETLMPALAELEAAWLEAREDPGYLRRARLPAARLRRPPDAALPRRRPDERRSAAPSTSSARTCSTPARTRSTTRSARRCWPADGQDAHHRRDRRGPARRRDRDRVRAARAGVRRLHGPRTCAGRRPNVERMELLGARSRRSRPAAATLKEAINEAMRDWVTNVRTTHYMHRARRRPAPLSRRWCAISSG